MDRVVATPRDDDARTHAAQGMARYARETTQNRAAANPNTRLRVSHACVRRPASSSSSSTSDAVGPAETFARSCSICMARWISSDENSKPSSKSSASVIYKALALLQHGISQTHQVGNHGTNDYRTYYLNDFEYLYWEAAYSSLDWTPQAPGCSRTRRRFPGQLGLSPKRGGPVGATQPQRRRGCHRLKPMIYWLNDEEPNLRGHKPAG